MSEESFFLVSKAPSMNVGAGWGGGRKRPLNSVLRSEWSLEGMATIDFNFYGHMKKAQSLAAGDDIQLIVAAR